MCAFGQRDFLLALLRQSVQFYKETGNWTRVEKGKGGSRVPGSDVEMLFTTALVVVDESAKSIRAKTVATDSFNHKQT